MSGARVVRRHRARARLARGSLRWPLSCPCRGRLTPPRPFLPHSSIEVGNGELDTVFRSMDSQVELFCQEIYNDPNFAGGFNLIGYSAVRCPADAFRGSGSFPGGRLSRNTAHPLPLSHPSLCGMTLLQ